MPTDSPAWLTALTVMAPVIASFGVLWLTNRQQTRNLRAQHALVLEKDKISVIVAKAEELYTDIQRWKKHFELSGLQNVSHFYFAKSKSDYLEKITESQLPIDFDLVRLELNLKAYFPELEPSFREAEKLVHVAGKISADMIMRFHESQDKKRETNGEYIKAQGLAARALDKFSSAVAAEIGDYMKLK